MIGKIQSKVLLTLGVEKVTLLLKNQVGLNYSTKP
jgi:hypothetical protein